MSIVLFCNFFHKFRFINIVVMLAPKNRNLLSCRLLNIFHIKLFAPAFLGSAVTAAEKWAAYSQKNVNLAVKRVEFQLFILYIIEYAII